MPTIIDALVVTLGLNSSDLDKKSAGAGRKLKDLEGASKSTEAGVKKLGDTAKESAGGVDTLAKAFASMLAVIGGAVAIKAFVSDMINGGAALDRLSKNLNVSAGDITAWGNAAEELGGSAKGVQSAMQLLSKAQTDIQLTGNSGLIPYFNMLGVSLADTSGHALKSTDILRQLASAAEGKDRRTMNNVFASMGFDEGTINLLLRGRSELELTLKRQKEYGEQAAKFAPEATKLQRSLVDLKQQFTLLGLNLVQQAAPAIEKVLGVLSSLGNWAKTNAEFLKDVALVLGAIGAGLGVIALVTSPITLVVAGVLALASAIALLWQDYQTWQRGGQTLIDWSKWQPGILAAETAIKNLAKVAKESFGAIFDSANGVWKLLHGDVKGAKQSFAKSDDKVRGALGTIVAGGHQEVAILHDPKSKLRGAKAPPAARASAALPQKKTLAEAIGQVEGFNAKGVKPNRPQRNHNPGDIEYGDFAKNHGATGTDGRFAIFPDDNTGMAALNALLATKKYADLTLSQAINRFAPPNENNTKGYTEQVAKMTGLAPTTKVSQALQGISGASSALNGIPGAASMVASAGSTPSSSTTTTHNDHGVTIHGDVKVQTMASDGPGVVKAFRDGMNGLLVGQGAGGLS